jgi:hypothetical protein
MHTLTALCFAPSVGNEKLIPKLKLVSFGSVSPVYRLQFIELRSTIMKFPTCYRSHKKLLKKNPWPEYARELYRPSDRRLSAKLVQTFSDRGCHIVSVTDPYGHILDLLDLSRYFFFQVVPQLYSRSWVPDPLLLRKSGSAWDRTWTSRSVARNSDH